MIAYVWMVKVMVMMVMMITVVVMIVMIVTVMMMTNLEPGSCDLDRLTGLAILSLRKPAVPLTLDADRASPVPILTMDTPSSTKVSSRLLLFALLLLLGLLALSWRFVG